MDRIALAIGAENDTDAAKILDVSRTTWGSWRVRDSVPYALCVSLAEDRGLSLDWLLTGEGHMHRVKAIYAPIEPAQPMALAEGKPVTHRQQAVLDLFEGLDEAARAELFGIAAEKKRIREIEKEIAELKLRDVKKRKVK